MGQRKRRNDLFEIKDSQVKQLTVLYFHDLYNNDLYLRWFLIYIHLIYITSDNLVICKLNAPAHFNRYNLKDRTSFYLRRWNQPTVDSIGLIIRFW